MVYKWKAARSLAVTGVFLPSVGFVTCLQGSAFWRKHTVLAKKEKGGLVNVSHRHLFLLVMDFVAVLFREPLPRKCPFRVSMGEDGQIY